ncbi:MAG: hypothetical protein SV966_09170 [Actinomycetota bacterium]|nr:hypothetical protein [Actinomycetota bacterium]
MSQQDNRAAKLAGLAIAGTGLAHFVRPQLFEPITVPAFPQNTRRHIYTNGGLETTIGLALAGRKTRRFGLAGLLGYTVYLAGNTVRKR